MTRLALSLLLLSSTANGFTSGPTFVGSRSHHGTALNGAPQDFIDKLQKDFKDMAESFDFAKKKTEAMGFAESLVAKARQMTGAHAQDEEPPQVAVARKKSPVTQQDMGAEQVDAMVESMQRDFKELQQHDPKKEHSSSSMLDQLDQSHASFEKTLEEIRWMQTVSSLEEPATTGSKVDLANMAPQEQVEAIKMQFSKMEDDLKSKKEFNPEDFAEMLLETAIQMTGAQRDLEMQHVDQAQAAVAQAMSEEERAKALAAQAYTAQMAAEQMTDFIESQETPNERMRDLSVVHAAHHVKEDAKNLFSAAKKTEMVAREEQDEAERTLKQLQSNEAALRSTLQQLRNLKADRMADKYE